MYKKFLKKEYLLLCLIILLGVFLRLQGVFTNSFAFTYDVGRDMLALFNIVNFHKIPLIGATTGINGIFYGPWWYYMLTPFFVIFRGNPQGIALTMAIIGIVTIVLGYYLGNKIGGKTFGLLFAFILSFSHQMVSLSSQIWNPNITPLFILLIFFILYQIYATVKKDKAKYFFLLGLLLALNIDLEIVFGLLFSTGIILSVFLIARKQINLKSVSYFLIGALIIFSPRIVFELRHQFLMTNALINFFIKGGSNQNTSVSGLFLNRFGVLFDQFNATFTFDNRILGLAVLLFVVLSSTFFYKKADTKIKNFINTSLIVVAVFFAGTAFFSHDIWPHYLVGLPVFYILLFGISLYLLIRKINYIFPLLIVLFVAFINLYPVYIQIIKPLWEGDASVYRNQLAVIDYVYKEANGKNFKYVVYTPPVYDYTYQYLFIWYGPKQYHYSPSQKADVAYFILEPDLQYPSRLTDWLKQREGDGKIIKSEKIKGGIIVQTRLVN